MVFMDLIPLIPSFAFFISSSVSILLCCTKHKEIIRIETFECAFLPSIFCLFVFVCHCRILLQRNFHSNLNKKENGNQIEFISNQWTHKKKKRFLRTDLIDSQRHYLFYSSFAKIILFSCTHSIHSCWKFLQIQIIDGFGFYSFHYVCLSCNNVDML